VACLTDWKILKLSLSYFYPSLLRRSFKRAASFFYPVAPTEIIRAKVYCREGNFYVIRAII
jgi:hypothetical protein